MVADYSNNPNLEEKEHLLTIAMLNWNARYMQFLGFKDHRAYFKILTIGTIIPATQAIKAGMNMMLRTCMIQNNHLEKLQVDFIQNLLGQQEIRAE